MTRRLHAPDHDPGCVACTDPGRAARFITARLADLDEEAAAVQQMRDAAAALRAKYPTTGGLAPEDAKAVEDVIRMRYEIANVAQMNVNFARNDLNGIVAAHPAVAELLTTPHNTSRKATK